LGLRCIDGFLEGKDFDIKILRSTNFLKYVEIVDEFNMTPTGQRKFY